MLNYWNTIAQQENSQYNAQLEMAYAQAMAAIQMGVVPSNDLLKKAGISSADAKAMAKAYKKGSSGGGGGSGGGSSGRSYSSGGSSGSGGGTQPKTNTPTNNGQLGVTAKTMLSAWQKGMKSGALTATKVVSTANAQVNNGTLTYSEAQTILKKLGLT